MIPTALLIAACAIVLILALYLIAGPRKPDGAELIERARLELPFAHLDVRFMEGELALAAACLATPASIRCLHAGVPTDWPLEDAQWQPLTRVEQLARAGALLALEIDRIQRREAIAAKALAQQVSA